MKCARWILFVLVACRSAPQAIKPQDVAAISPASGEVSAKLIADPNAPTVQLGPDEDFVEPRLRPENRPPEYPSELIPLHLAPHTIAARVTFDERGVALSVVPSPIAASTDDQYRPAFQREVETALMRWRCQPPRIRKFRPGPDADGDGKPDYRIVSWQRTLKTFFDVSFSFEVVNGKPVVRSAATH